MKVRFIIEITKGKMKAKKFIKAKAKKRKSGLNSLKRIQKQHYPNHEDRPDFNKAWKKYSRNMPKIK